jgi:hypothetical protein
MIIVHSKNNLYGKQGIFWKEKAGTERAGRGMARTMGISMIWTVLAGKNGD